MMELDAIIIEGDCIAAIQWMQHLGDRQNKIHRMVDGPDLSFLMNFKQVLFQHVNRNSNRPADCCSKLAIVDSFLFKDVNNPEFPSTLLSLLREDSDRV